MDGKSYNAELCEKFRDGEENPFWTIEALGENIQACWGALAELGFEVWDRSETYPDGSPCLQRPRGEVGSAVYHLKAIDQYHQKILNAMAALLPDLDRMSEGETTGLNKFKLHLTELAAVHQRKWEKL